jgi:hypothetical protein
VAAAADRAAGLVDRVLTISNASALSKYLLGSGTESADMPVASRFRREVTDQGFADMKVRASGECRQSECALRRGLGLARSPDWGKRWSSEGFKSSRINIQIRLCDHRSYTPAICPKLLTSSKRGRFMKVVRNDMCQRLVVNLTNQAHKGSLRASHLKVCARPFASFEVSRRERKSLVLL